MTRKPSTPYGSICPKCGKPSTFTRLGKDPWTNHDVYQCEKCDRRLTDSDFEDFRRRND